MLDKETNRSIIDYSILLIENGFINNGSNIKRKTIVPSSYLEELIDIINDSENMIEVDPVIAAIFEEESNRFLMGECDIDTAVETFYNRSNIYLEE